MYYIGLDVHKKTISYCVKDAAGRVHQEGKIGSTRRELDAWIKTLPQPRMIAMEATIFTGWIYDHLLPHAEKVKVAHPLMLRAIAAAKRKNDKIDAGKIADCLRCDFLPECHMASTEIRNRRRILRYRGLVLRQAVQMKNRVSGLLMETGVSYNKLRLHRMGYFAELMSTNEEVSESIRPLLRLCREHIDRSIRLDTALLRSLEQDPLLADRLRRLRTIPGVGPITALTWALEVRRYFPLPVNQAGDQLLRAVQRREELGRQGDAHADLEAAQQAYPAGAGGSGQAGTALQRRTGPAPRKGTTTRQRQPGHACGGQEDGRVDAGRGKTQHGFRARERVPTNRGSVRTFLRRKNIRIDRCAGCQVPQITGWATEATPEALFGLFRDWQRTQTQSSATAPRSLRQQMDVRFC